MLRDLCFLGVSPNILSNNIDLYVEEDSQDEIMGPCPGKFELKCDKGSLRKHETRRIKKSLNLFFRPAATLSPPHGAVIPGLFFIPP